MARFTGRQGAATLFCGGQGTTDDGGSEPPVDDAPRSCKMILARGNVLLAAPLSFLESLLMSTSNTKKESARVVDGLVTAIVQAHGGTLDADTARGLLLMGLKRVDVREAIVRATNPAEMPTREQLTELHLPPKKPSRSAKKQADPAACAAATNASMEDDEDGEDDAE